MAVAAACTSEDPELECERGEVATFYCAQGNPETHVCTDSMWPPTCVDGRWDCGDGSDAAPEPEIDCWCHVGPPDWRVDASLCDCTEAEGYTCDFRCGPTLLCRAWVENCEIQRSDVGGEPDSFGCVPIASGCRGCDCIPPGASSCEEVENGGVVVTYPGG